MDSPRLLMVGIISVETTHTRAHACTRENVTLLSTTNNKQIITCTRQHNKLPKLSNFFLVLCRFVMALLLFSLWRLFSYNDFCNFLFSFWPRRFNNAHQIVTRVNVIKPVFCFILWPVTIPCLHARFSNRAINRHGYVACYQTAKWYSKLCLLSFFRIFSGLCLILLLHVHLRTERTVDYKISVKYSPLRTDFKCAFLYAVKENTELDLYFLTKKDAVVQVHKRMLLN